METDLISKSNERLYKKLKQEYPDLIVGAGIKKKDGANYIVLFLIYEPAPDVMAKITEDFEGFKVTAEVTGMAVAGTV